MAYNHHLPQNYFIIHKQLIKASPPNRSIISPPKTLNDSEGQWGSIMCDEVINLLKLIKGTSSSHASPSRYFTGFHWLSIALLVQIHCKGIKVWWTNNKVLPYVDMLHIPKTFRGLTCFWASLFLKLTCFTQHNFSFHSNLFRLACSTT